MEDGIKNIIVASLICPECGGDNIIFREFVPYYHPVYGVDDTGKILVQVDADAGDYADDPKFVCMDCGEEFENEGVEFTNWSQIEDMRKK